MSSLQSFLHMGGYAMYVWPAYFLTLVVLILNVILPIKREGRFFRTLAERKRRQEKSK
jgi:heme exporter protein D